MYIVSSGMVCSVGLNAEAACAAMRAGISGFEELPYADNLGKQIIGASVPMQEHVLWSKERLVELLAIAVKDCLREKIEEPLEEVPIFIGLAEQNRPSGESVFAELIIRKLEQKLGVRFHPKYSNVILEGHTAGFRALEKARFLIQERHASVCIVCGVDSYLNAQSLLRLEEKLRLKTEHNADGIIPGEAAASVIIRGHSNKNTSVQTRLLGLGFAMERATVMSEEPLFGLGLTEATIKALSEARLQMHEIGFRLSDVTGESYGFREQALVIAKLLRVHKEEGYPLWHCAEYIGDTGAAAGIIQMIMAHRAFVYGYAPGPTCVCSTSSISGRRAALVLTSI